LSTTDRAAPATTSWRAPGLFQGVAAEAARRWPSACSTATTRRGETVFTEGEQGDTLYIVLSAR
jgi:CRP-like cAMP-binding protein